MAFSNELRRVRGGGGVTADVVRGHKAGRRAPALEPVTSGAVTQGGLARSGEKPRGLLMLDHGSSVRPLRSLLCTRSDAKAPPRWPRGGKCNTIRGCPHGALKGPLDSWHACCISLSGGIHEI
jgi:hypothetical protein